MGGQVEQGMLNVEVYSSIQNSIFNIGYSKCPPSLTPLLSLLGKRGSGGVMKDEDCKNVTPPSLPLS
jgi:hypothetical protein